MHITKHVILFDNNVVSYSDSLFLNYVSSSLCAAGRNDNGMNSSGINSGAGTSGNNSNTVGKLDSANVTRVLYQVHSQYILST
jgi:hypothetical protein